MGYVERALNNDINNSNTNKIAKLRSYVYLILYVYEEFYKHRF